MKGRGQPWKGSKIYCPQKRRMKIHITLPLRNIDPEFLHPSNPRRIDNQRKYSMGQICNKHRRPGGWSLNVCHCVPKWVTGKAAVPHKLLLCFVELLFWQRFLRSKGPSSCAWRAEPLLMCFVLTKRPEGCLSPAESCVFQADRKEEAHS